MLRATGGGIRTAVGNRELERCTPPDFRFHPDPAAFAFDNLLAKRQADARAGNLAPMQALKHAEHPVRILRIDPDSVVAPGQNALAAGVVADTYTLG